MLNRTDVRELVTREIQTLLEEAFLEPTELNGDDNLILLGFNSLMLARLVVELDRALEVDPFASEQAQISDIHTIGDVVRAYSAAV